ncbi:hypothetical protein [Kordia sp.]|uniref:hypothetical protein n=1 Tax=Kordia sp. TaxID=1965332 RepID=UPI003D2A3064
MLNEKKILYFFGKQRYENAASQQKEFVLVKDAGHFDVYTKGGKDYGNKLLNFINTQL